ncbi:MAG: DMT family transporter, partial [Desulfobacterales bacterium]|nr:DMT family transporter [Desulfobacterales bacterium]
YRFLLAALTLTLLQFTGIIMINLRNKPLGTLFLLVLFQPIIYFIFATIGVKMTSSSEAGMLIAIIPVVVTIFSVIFLHERPTILQIGSIILSVSGVIFIVWMKGSMGSRGNIWGILVLLVAVIAAGAYNILSRKLSLSFNPVELTFVMMWSGAIVFNCISLFQHWIQGEISLYFNALINTNVLTSILYLGVISSIGAFFLVNFMLSKMEASRSAVFANLTTVVAVMAGVIFRGDPFYWYHALGSVLILLGVYGTNYFSIAKKTKNVDIEAQAL